MLEAVGDASAPVLRTALEGPKEKARRITSEALGLRRPDHSRVLATRPPASRRRRGAHRRRASHGGVITAWICNCGGPMLPAGEGADFDLSLPRLADGSSNLMSPRCLLLSGAAQVRRFAQDCFGAKGGDCATVADVTLAGEGELGRARFSGR